MIEKKHLQSSNLLCLTIQLCIIFKSTLVGLGYSGDIVVSNSKIINAGWVHPLLTHYEHCPEKMSL